MAYMNITEGQKQDILNPSYVLPIYWHRPYGWLYVMQLLRH